MSTELATWLVGSAIVVEGDDLAVSAIENAAAIMQTDCLLNIIIENAQDNQNILLPTLQFVEVSLGLANQFPNIVEVKLIFFSTQLFRLYLTIRTHEFCTACCFDTSKPEDITIQMQRRPFRHGPMRKMSERSAVQRHPNPSNRSP